MMVVGKKEEKEGGEYRIQTIRDIFKSLLFHPNIKNENTNT